jgi:hypothetical protein
MNEATSLAVSVSHDSSRKNQKLSRLLTLERVIEWIERQELDEYTTKGLVEMASKYPSHALPSFRKNFNLMVQRVRAKRKKEGAINVQKTDQDQTTKEDQNKFTNFEDALNANWEDEKPSKEVVGKEEVEKTSQEQDNFDEFDANADLSKLIVSND